MRTYKRKIIDFRTIGIKPGDIVEFLSEEEFRLYFRGRFGDSPPGGVMDIAVPDGINNSMLSLAGSLFRVTSVGESTNSTPHLNKNIREMTKKDYYTKQIKFELHKNNSDNDDETLCIIAKRYTFNTSMVKLYGSSADIEYELAKPSLGFKDAIKLL